MKNYFTQSLDARPSGYDALLLPFKILKNGASKSAELNVVEPMFDLGQLGKGSAILLQYELMLRAHGFSSDSESAVVQYVDSPYEKRVVFVGVRASDAAELSAESIRNGYAAAIRRLLGEEGVHSISIAVPSVSSEPGLDVSSIVHSVVEGVRFGSYRFSRYFSEAPKSCLEQVCYIADASELTEEAVKNASTICDAVEITRDLVNANASDTTPEAIALCVEKVLAHQKISVDVHHIDWIRQQKMGLIEAVGAGASNASRFVVIDWKGADANRSVFIGKGVTYDTGGLNLKPTGFMETMRCDMAGAGTLVGLMYAISKMDLPIWVTAILPLVENAVDANSMKPGDVYRSRRGTTVEIANTDAEGRLILADAIDYAITELAPARIIDVATLTGASEIALGTDISALFSNADSLVHDLEKAACRSGESVWRLPLYAKYKELLQSDFADMKNVSSGRAGGAINAALFLEHFVGTTPWAHFDIAGPAYFKDGRGMYRKGASSIPLRTLIEYCMHLAES